jgi:hypothetical protein
MADFPDDPAQVRRIEAFLPVPSRRQFVNEPAGPARVAPPKTRPLRVSKIRRNRFVPSRTALHYAARRVGPHFLATLLEIVRK